MADPTGPTPCARDACRAGPNKSVKRADRPDSVHRPSCENRRDRHSSGPRVAHPARCHLPASSAEPRQRWPTWCCCAQRLPVSPELNRLVSVALILTSRWRGVASYAVLCSPDVPPVPPFGDCTSDGLASFTGRLSPVGLRTWRNGTLNFCGREARLAIMPFQFAHIRREGAAPTHHRDRNPS